MARFRATVTNYRGVNEVSLQMNDQRQAIEIPPKAEGYGSRLSGAELLFLALATCYCNDIYREAAKRGISVEQVEVEVSGDFGAEGEPASNIAYRATVTAQGSEADIRELMRYTDQVAEIQNTLRVVTPVTLHEVEVVTR